MKTNFLFSAALLLSIATTAQTSVKGKQTAQTASSAKSGKAGTNVQSSGDASSAVAVQARELKSMEPGTNKKGEELKDEIAAKKAAATQNASAAKPVDPAATVQSSTSSSSAIAVQAQEFKNMEPGANKKGALVKDEIAAKQAAATQKATIEQTPAAPTASTQTSANTSSAIAVQARELKNMEPGANKKGELLKDEIAAKRTEATHHAKGKLKKAENEVPQEVAVSADTDAASNANAAKKDNKTTGNASLSAGATVTGNGINNNARELKAEAVQVINKGATTSAKVIAVKPAPASIRVNSRVKAATRIKIK